MRAAPGQPRNGRRRAPRAAPRPSVRTTHATSERSATHEIAISAPRQPSSQRGERHGERGRARRADLDARSCRRRCPRPGRCSKCSLTEIGARALPSPIPIPTGQVSRTTSQADGITARRTPNVPISASPIVIARRVPILAAR